ncbi:MAG: tyrosine-type recombinase/integrase [Pelagibacteraceae bacterium]|jgi:integrase|nr:tyrosine-type recombinase/integrase [Pelagibacteraceae bacterium]MBT3901461.1 tyrosine-type recombinase/integrase [Pelagibacteraceae bacterium]MBT4951917.1 tyrosine-type recombinase/integrase [Pelagibacteraceae bacterium]MBT5214077.1 tyrosine-type recombinase/integrase [Pelagibacteraceae bacterium]MBT6353419.1 tyrosine-type recombinase/integrase [Pelagibacteraceae bacterium]
MATITKRKSGKWTAEVRTHKKYISKTFIKKSNASNWAKEIEYQLDREQYEDFSESVRITLGELITRYRDEITPTKKGAKEEKYKLNFILRNKIVKCRVLSLKTKQILEFKNDIKETRAASTVNKYIHYIYTIWETARVQWDIALPSRNPVSLVKKEKVTDKIDRILTPEEYQDLLVACSKSNLAFLPEIVEFAYITAMRFGEITKLETKDINFEKSTALLLDTKNGESRLVPLTDRALEICNKFRFREKLFDINRDKFRHYFEQACFRAKVKNFRFHDLRACAITNLFLNGWSIAEVSVVSGHKTWSELKRYTRIKASDLIKKINNQGVA